MCDRRKKMTMVRPDSSHKYEEKVRKLFLDNIMKGTPSKQIANLTVYNIPLQRTFTDRRNMYQKFTFGNETLKLNEKVILVMGATGTGKSTLINAMMNSILGVEWEDPFRFRLIDEHVNKNQAHSQTSMVTAYEIHWRWGFKIPFPLTVIDTPGFGDTQGLAKDRQTLEQLKECFSSSEFIDHVNAVCFVVQGSSVRLSPAQKYIFNSIYSMFGKDIADNILFMITFGGEESPPVLASIKEADLPSLKDDEGTALHYSFNNCAVFASNNPARSSISKEYWRMGAESMTSFFDQLEALPPKSLVLTNEVLRERTQLEATLQLLIPEIKAGLTKLEAMRKTEKALEENLGKMENSKDFSFEVAVVIKIAEQLHNSYAMNCQQCDVSCHYPCKVVKGLGYFCEVIDVTGNCKICPDECKIGQHKREKYKWVTDTVVKREEYNNLKTQYENAYSEAMTGEKILAKLNNECAAVNEKVLKLIGKTTKCLKRVQEIALKPNALTTTEYIEQMIKNEEMAAEAGYPERITFLRELKEQAVILQKIENNEKLLPQESKKQMNYQERIAQIPAEVQRAIVCLCQKADTLTGFLLREY